MPKMMHLSQARAEGYTIEPAPTGKYVAYKGGRYAPTKIYECYTELEEELIEALRGAIRTYEFASMTAWEREVTEEDRKVAEELLNRLGE